MQGPDLELINRLKQGQQPSAQEAATQGIDPEAIRRVLQDAQSQLNIPVEGIPDQKIMEYAKDPGKMFEEVFGGGDDYDAFQKYLFNVQVDVEKKKKPTNDVLSIEEGAMLASDVRAHNPKWNEGIPDDQIGAQWANKSIDEVYDELNKQGAIPSTLTKAKFRSEFEQYIRGDSYVTDPEAKQNAPDKVPTEESKLDKAIGEAVKADDFSLRDWAVLFGMGIPQKYVATKAVEALPETIAAGAMVEKFAQNQALKQFGAQLSPEEEHEILVKWSDRSKKAEKAIEGITDQSTLDKLVQQQVETKGQIIGSENGLMNVVENPMETFMNVAGAGARMAGDVAASTAAAAAGTAVGGPGVGTIAGGMTWALAGSGAAVNEWVELVEQRPELKNNTAVRDFYIYSSGAIMGIFDKIGLEGVFGKWGAAAARKAILGKVLNRLGKAGTKVTSEVLEREIELEARKASSMALQSKVRGLVGFLYEGGSELGEEFLIDQTKYAANMLADTPTDIFDEEELKRTALNRYANSFAMGGVLGGGMATVAGALNTENVLRSAIADASSPEKVEAIRNATARQLQQNGFGQRDIEAMDRLIDKYNELYQKMPKDMRAADKVKAASLIENRSKIDDIISTLEQEKEGLDESFQQSKDAEIKGLQEQRQVYQDHLQAAYLGNVVSYALDAEGKTTQTIRNPEGETTREVTRTAYDLGLSLLGKQPTAATEKTDTAPVIENAAGLETALVSLGFPSLNNDKLNITDAEGNELNDAQMETAYDALYTAFQESNNSEEFLQKVNDAGLSLGVTPEQVKAKAAALDAKLFPDAAETTTTESKTKTKKTKATPTAEQVAPEEQAPTYEPTEISIENNGKTTTFVKNDKGEWVNAANKRKATLNQKAELDKQFKQATTFDTEMTLGKERFARNKNNEWINLTTNKKATTSQVNRLNSALQPSDGAAVRTGLKNAGLVSGKSLVLSRAKATPEGEIMYTTKEHKGVLERINKIFATARKLGQNYVDVKNELAKANIVLGLASNKTHQKAADDYLKRMFPVRQSKKVTTSNKKAPVKSPKAKLKEALKSANKKATGQVGTTLTPEEIEVQRKKHTQAIELKKDQLGQVEYDNLIKANEQATTQEEFGDILQKLCK